MRLIVNTQIFGIAVLGLLFNPAQAGELQFHSEFIQITVDKDECLVTGQYQFAKRSQIPLAQFPLYYPFLIASDLPYPDSIQVWNERTGAGIPFSELERGIVFQIDLPPMGHGIYTVHYHQPTPAQRFEYILETTQQWKQPLATAEFRVTLPKAWIITDLSLDYDSTQESDSTITYVITKQDFMPNTNLIIQWEVSNHEP